ncbi:MAG: LacI family DNA-binding transcriptional regulator, partial [Agromyces sp.]
LARALVETGYRSFAALTGAEGLRTAEDRLGGFLAGLAASGISIDPARIVRPAFTRDGGYDGMRTLIDRGIDGIDAVFAANDVMAVGAMSAIRDAGLVPGRDIAIAGFDDIPTARDVTPPLSTVRLPLEEVGRRALRLALDTDAGGDLPVPAEVILRASTPTRAR